jgi:hypothetical protein
MRYLASAAIVLAASICLPTLAQENAPETPHQPVMTHQVYLGYQINLFSETLKDLQPPTTGVARDVKAEGLLYHGLRAGGQTRAYDVLLFGEYTFLNQPVTNRINSEQFNRATHFIDAGLGYIFPLVKDRIEIAPYLGLNGQFYANDKTQTNTSIYYHVGQSRLAFGAGARYTMRFDDTLPFPLFLNANLGFYPLSTVTTADSNALFVPGASVIQFGASFYGRFLPYLGAELGFRQQFQNGGTSAASFGASWTDFFLNMKLEPEVFFKP